MEIMSVATQQIIKAWDTLRSHIPISPIRNEQQYDQAVEKLNELLDIVGDNETHPLYDLLDTLGTLIHAYEETHYPAPTVKGMDVLKFLMEEHQLSPSSLPEIGNEEVVSQLLAGKRELSVENIRALSQRFGVSPATFIN
jgi:HTH-type transcriptional regulator/antitoxin HigA